MEVLANTEVATGRDASQAASAIAVLACSWPALILATACLLPFLNKPFLIDDPWFLSMAQQIVKHPAHPMDFTVCPNFMRFAGACTTASNFAAGNPLSGQIAQGYILVPTILGGAHEWAAHLTELLLAWIAILAMTSLTLRLGWDRGHAISGALLLVAIPPFLAMSSTAMPDILASALALIAIERIAAWKAEEKWSQGAAAAIALGLAGFARPHLVLLVPLAAFFLLDTIHPREILAQARRKLWLWTPVIGGVCLVAAIVLSLREPIPGIFPSNTATTYRLARNLPAYFLFLAFPFPLALCWLVNLLRTKRRLTLIVASAAAFQPWLWPIPRSVAAVFSFAILGCGALFGLLFETLKKRDHSALFLLLWILIPLPVVIYAHFPIKYFLPCLPAIIFMSFRLMETVPLRIARIAALVAIVAYTGYSILILRSDDDFAEIGRNSLYELIAPHVAAGEQVWYSGTNWSSWYAPLAGAKLTYPGGPQPKRGDLMVDDVFAGGDELLKRFPHRTLVQTIHYTYRFGRTMGTIQVGGDKRPGVGLYSNVFGYWLWGFGEDPDDRFELWRID
jgi:hypothetical protein